MNSSPNEARNNLASPSASELLIGLQELANLLDEPASFERFARRRPGFIHVRADDLPYSLSVPVTGLPNLPSRYLHMWQRREDLRQVWRGHSEKLAAILLPGVPPEELSIEERNEHVSRDESDTAGEWQWAPQIKVDWQRSQFVYEPRTEFQRAVYALFRKSALAKVCANPDCVAPYFIAGRAVQRYCSDACAQVFQRAYKLRWWKERGSEWRRKKSRGKGGKR
jgi:hypothetical protein